MADISRLTSRGVPTELAVEIDAQITSGETSRRRLEELGMTPHVAKELVANIGAGEANKRRLVNLGMIPEVVREIAKLIEEAQPEPDPEG